MAKKAKKKTRKRSVRAERRRQVLKLVDEISGTDPGNAEILQSAHRAMLLVDEEESEQRREKWRQRLQAAVTPALEHLLSTGDKNQQMQAGFLAARLIDSPGEHAVKAKRYDYGSMVVETLGTLGMGKLQAAVDTGGGAVKSEAWLRIMADLRPLMEETVERSVREALAKT